LSEEFKQAEIKQINAVIEKTRFAPPFFARYGPKKALEHPPSAIVKEISPSERPIF